MRTAFRTAAAESTGEQDARARIGVLALRTPPPATEDERLALVRTRLGCERWPNAPMLVTAVDAADGAFVTFDADSGVDLTRAVAASCAVPTVWPPMIINGRGYLDGGVRSSCNADLATGHDRVLIVSCFPQPPVNPFGPSLTQATEALRRTGQVFHVQADPPSVAAFGVNPLDPAIRAASAHAGIRQAAAVAEDVRSFWN